MAPNISYKQKLKILPYLFLAVIILVYWIAVSGTVDLFRACTELQRQIVSAGVAPRQIDSLASRLNDLNRLTGNNETGIETDPFLNFISTRTNSSNRLIKYLPLHFFRNKSYLIETRSAVFEGSFRSLTEFLFALEKEYPSGKIVSVKFETETNLKTEKTRLLMTLFIQSVTNEKDTLNTDKTTTDS
jgi:hypothetical protein